MSCVSSLWKRKRATLVGASLGCELAVSFRASCCCRITPRHSYEYHQFESSVTGGHLPQCLGIAVLVVNIASGRLEQRRISALPLCCSHDVISCLFFGPLSYVSLLFLTGVGVESVSVSSVSTRLPTTVKSQTSKLLSVASCSSSRDKA